MDPNFLSQVLQSIEAKLEEVSQKTAILDAKSEQMSKQIKLELPVLFSKTHTLETTIGNRVKYDATELSAPTVWSSIAMLTTLVHQHQTRMDALPDLTRALKSSIINELTHSIEGKIGAINGECTSKVEKVEESLAKCVQQIAERMYQDTLQGDHLRARLNQVENHIGTMGSNKHQGITSQHSNELTDLRDRVEVQLELFRAAIGIVNRKVVDLIADTHQDSIKFNGFGFRQMEEANAWLEKHLPNHKFG
jgi:hypothetical protein